MSLRVLICSLAAVFLAACTPQMPENYKENLFPAEIEREPRRDFYSNWFGRNLYFMREKALWNADLKDDELLVVRLLILPSVGAGSLVRLNLMEDGKGRFVQKDPSGVLGCQVGWLYDVDAGAIPGQDVKKFQKVVSDLRLFAGGVANGFDETVPYLGGDGKPADLVVLDGTTIVLEFKSRQDYFILQRHEHQVSQSSKLGMLISDVAQAGGQSKLIPYYVWSPRP